MDYTKVELLAPAGGREALAAAVLSGADAVYLGGNLFSARAGAGNFDLETLPEALGFAHRHGVKVYITVNTLVKDRELGDLYRFLGALEDMGVDAVILQDPGVLNLVRREFPGLVVHASTQMTLHNTPGVRFLRDRGARRVVLARENTLEEIRTMAGTGVELEAFVHGALCICYSGQCLMSSMIGGRSGNRGRCAQPCRMKYSMVASGDRVVSGAADRYLLSPRDLNTVDFLDEILEAGVTSLKIEGRMKRPEYVATVVRNYRTRLDVLAGRIPQEDAAERDRQLEQIFNRSFTPGYFKGNPRQDLMNWQRPNNRGVFAGRIRQSLKGGFLIALDTPLSLGDGLEIWVTKGGRSALTVDRMLVEGRPVENASPGETVEIRFSGTVWPGDRVFRTSDAGLLEEARSLVETARFTEEIPLQVQVEGSVGQPLRMILTDSRGNRVEGESGILLEEAINRPLTEELIRDKMRLGGSGYVLESLNVQLEKDLMLPVSALNRLRQELVARLTEMNRPAGPGRRSGVWKPPAGRRAARREPMVLSVEVDSPEDAITALEAGAGRVLIHTTGLRDRKRNRDLTDIGSWPGREVIYVLPRILKDDQLEEHRDLVKHLEKRADGFAAGSLGTLAFLKENTDLPLSGDYSLHVFNGEGLRFFREEGLRLLCLSPELTLEEMGILPGEGPLEALVHGSIPLMIMEHCAVGAAHGGGFPECGMPCRREAFYLKDRMDYRFRLLCDTSCRMSVLNARELCLAEDLPRLAEAGISHVRLMLRERGSREIRQITGIYRDLLADGSFRRQDLEEALDALKKLSPYGFTKGHYYREVE